MSNKALVRKMPQHLQELSRLLPLTLTLQEAADVAHVSVRTLQRFVERQQLAVIRVGDGRNARVVVTRTELMRWLSERSV